MYSSSSMDLHDDDITYIMPRLLMVSLNYLSHRKCIGFADLQVNFVLQNLHNVAWSYEIPGTAQLCNFLIANSRLFGP